MTPADINVEFANEEDVAEAVGSALAGAGVTFEQLRQQAEARRFTSERALSLVRDIPLRRSRLI
jgi:hypothetical protein